MKKLLLLTLLLFALASPILAQESILKDFSEPRRPSGSTWLNPICLYASTLRMINISQDPNYNELVNDIDKILIYTLDPAIEKGEDFTSWIRQYEDLGYEEYIRLSGPQRIRIVGKEEEYVGLMKAEDQFITFYLKGAIPFHKIPTLIQSFKSDDLLGILTDQFK